MGSLGARSNGKNATLTRALSFPILVPNFAERHRLFSSWNRNVRPGKYGRRVGRGRPEGSFRAIAPVARPHADVVRRRVHRLASGKTLSCSCGPVLAWLPRPAAGALFTGGQATRSWFMAIRFLWSASRKSALLEGALTWRQNPPLHACPTQIFAHACRPNAVCMRNQVSAARQRNAALLR